VKIGVQYKMRRKGVTDPNKLNDLVGFRVIVSDESDINKVYSALESQMSILDTHLIEGTTSNLSELIQRFKEGSSVQKADNSYSALYLPVTIGKNRAELPEWRGFGGFVAEIQVLTQYGSAFREAEHIHYYKEDHKSIRKIRPILEVTTQLTVTLNNFRKLLDKPDLHEKRDIHPFIEKNQFILHSNPVDFYSEVPIGLGTEYKMDFMVREGDGSYLLVEIENAKHKLFTKDGDFTAIVNHAQRQVEDWQQWIDENISLMQREYPDIISPKGLVVIGRRNELSDEEKNRLARRNANLRGSLTIWTYDDLLENAKYFIESIKKNTTCI